MTISHQHPAKSSERPSTDSALLNVEGLEKRFGGIIRQTNFVHGDVVIIGAFVTLGLLRVAGAPFPKVALLVLCTGALVGIMIEKGAFRPMRGDPNVTGFIASLAVSIMNQNLGLYISL